MCLRVRSHLQQVRQLEKQMLSLSCWTSLVAVEIVLLMSASLKDSFGDNRS